MFSFRLFLLLICLKYSCSCNVFRKKRQEPHKKLACRHRDELHNAKRAKHGITIPDSYHATGLLTLPYDGIMESFEIWYADEYCMSRIDYYHGLDKTFQRGDLDNFGIQVKEIPIHRSKSGNNKKHGTQCWHQKGTKRNHIKPQSVVPMDLSHYKKAGEEYRSGTLAIKLVRHLKTGDLNNTFMLWVTKSKPHRPIRFETKGFDFLIGGYYDHYFIDYVTFTEYEVDYDVMEIPEESSCYYALYNATSHYLMNPMSEFVHHPHEVPKHHNITERSYHDFKAKHSKTYHDGKQHTKRKNIYRHNARYVRSKNRAKLNYTLALNHLADVTPEEFSMMNDLLERPDEGMEDSLQDIFPKRGEVPTVSYDMPYKTLPDQLDWREYDVVSPVRGQSFCGSCWAFSTVGMLEGAYKIATGEDTQFSAQMLVDCTYGYKNYGCRGGWPWKAMQWVIRNGIATKKSYGRYLAQEGLCHCGLSEENCKLLYPTSFGNIMTANTTAMKISLAKYGPVSVGINSVPKSFKFYRNGIYDDEECDENVEHSVLIVGFGEDIDGFTYWIIKNSWGPYWGRKGYMRIANDVDVCGILESNGVVASFRNDSRGYPFQNMKKVITPHDGNIEDHFKHDDFTSIVHELPFE